MSVFQVTEGHLSVRADLGDGAHALTLPTHRVDVGQWVQVALSRHGNLFVLQLEGGGGSREVRARLGSHMTMEIDPTSVTVGNGPRAENTSDFQGKKPLPLPSLLFSDWLLSAPSGCLRDVRFNGQLLPLDGRDRDAVAVLERRGVAAGCSSDACSGRPCGGLLRCVDLWRKHQCR